MEIKIEKGIVTRSIESPSKEEAERVCLAIKDKYGLGWAALSAVFGMKANNQTAMNIKHWCAGRKDMPLAHYFLALQILGEFKVKVSEIK